LRDNAKTFQHLQNIWGILQQTQGFDPLRFVPVLTKVLTNSQTHAMGREIAEGLAQKAIARLIRNLVLEFDKPQKSLT
jgi:hypothetical protein